MRYILILKLLALALFCQQADAQAMRRIQPQPDCLALLDNVSSSGLLDWKDLVEVEHCDRINRLRRIAELHGLGDDVEFYEGNILASQLPADVNVRIPILRVVFRERVFFDTDSSRLRPEAYEIVRIVAESLQMEPPDVALFVAGHADERGDAAYNLNLSIDRSNALAEAIMNYGVNQASVWRVGFGEDLPLVAGSNRYAWGQNRRIEFLFAARPEALAVFMVNQQVDMVCQGRSAAETAKCRQTLDLKTNYDIVEVQTRSAAVDPSRSGSQADPESTSSTASPKVTKVAVAPTVRKIRIDPTNGSYKIVNPVNNR